MWVPEQNKVKQNMMFITEQMQQPYYLNRVKVKLCTFEKW